MFFAEAIAASDPAPSRRDNQDASFVLCGTGATGPYAVIAVADGVGGLDGGSLASRAAVSAVRPFASYDRVDFDLLFERANEAVLAVGANFPRGAASTLSVVVIEGTSARVATTGDTIAVLARRGVLVSQTVPDVSTAPRGARITRYLGSTDTYAPTQVEWPVEIGDVLIVCSDGVWRFVDISDLSELTADAGNLADCVSAAIERARDAGSDDDATIAVAKISS